LGTFFFDCSLFTVCFLLSRYVIPDEADCFWCFVGLMDKMERNFDQDQSGMHNQLLALRKLVQLLDPQLFAHFECQEQCQNYLFCYRWLLLHFKREFAFDDCLRLWESLWTCAFCDQLHMYVFSNTTERKVPKLNSHSLHRGKLAES